MGRFVTHHAFALICLCGGWFGTGGVCVARAADAADYLDALTPRPTTLRLEGDEGVAFERLGHLSLPTGSEHDACRTVLLETLGTQASRLAREESKGNTFAIGSARLQAQDAEGVPADGYVVKITKEGIAAKAGSPAGLMYAAQTLRQLWRVGLDEKRLPAMTIIDRPAFPLRGIYVEGGQERFGRIVSRNYLIEQIRRLAEFKMNTLVIECYNLFPYASFPACADEGTLSREDVRAIVAESKRWHVTIMPSLQTLAQAYELVWTCDAGKPYREATAPGLMCPSNPDIYPLIEGFYRDLLTWFDDSPLIGIGCSEIDMQWQQKYCEKCRRRIDKGETVRDLLLGHAGKCIDAVHRVSDTLHRKVRPLMWGDEFYMYGPGKDWVGIDRISHDTIMGYWKYWSDYAGIGELLRRGYDVLGISAMYNHTFYLADLSPQDPPKVWGPMEQTGTRNIDGLLRAGAEAKSSGGGAKQFLGVATASFSKHRLRAFDSIWYGFALNGHIGWSGTSRSLDQDQPAYTRAFTRHYYDARTSAAGDVLGDAYEKLDACKSKLERANQALHDVVGVYDVQEPGYVGNTLLGAFCRSVPTTRPEGPSADTLKQIRENAAVVAAEARGQNERLGAIATAVGASRELADLQLAAEKIALHAEREILMIDTQAMLSRAEGEPRARVVQDVAGFAKQWVSHREKVQAVLEKSKPLYSRGDPLGLESLLADIRAIETHLASLGESSASGAPDEPRVLIEDRFTSLDRIRWIVLGEPRVADGRLETRAKGGWEHYCGIVTRQPIDLDEKHPVVVEFELTPRVTGVDSQLIAAAQESGQISYRFAMSCAQNRLNVHTQSATTLPANWVNSEAGWRQRSASPPIAVNISYRVRAEILRRSWRVRVWEKSQPSLQPPLWDTGAVPMDDLPQTRLLFADVEPEGGAGASAWGAIVIRAARP